MLQHITLNLARNPDFPEGSAQCGYDIVAPLDTAGYLDAGEWKHARERCNVRRFWVDETDRIGLLVHHAGGAHGATWKIDYGVKAEGEDEAGYQLDRHRFVADEYVSISEADGSSHTFQIKAVRPA